VNQKTVLLVLAAVAFYLWWKSRRAGVASPAMGGGSGVARPDQPNPWVGVAAGAAGSAIDALGGLILGRESASSVDPNAININAD
jgi:hypothetical protein